MRRLLLALGLLLAGLAPALPQASISSLPQVASPRDADLFVLDVQANPVGQRTRAVPASGLVAYILGKIPLGPQGVPGQTGPAGPGNTLSVASTTTGAPGTAAAVTVSGAAPAQTLAFTIPAGQPNILGISSVTTGAPGSQAAVAITGTSPSQQLAFTLPQGATGAIGATGPQGNAGPVGPAGVAGPAGPTGPQGSVGATGQTGPPNSLSIGTVAGGASASATIAGTAPSQTLSLVLPQGPAGATGATGATGSQGNVGATGQTGAAGPTGAAGAAGPQGTQGVPGTQGPQGAQGPQGVAAGFSSVSATTLTPGSQATATLGGTGPQSYTLTFGLPQGTPGNGNGNVNSTGTIRTGALAIYGDTTGNVLKDGGLPAAVATSGSASDLGAGTLPAARLPALTGDVTTSAGSTATALATSGVTAGSYGAANTVPVLTVDAKGRVTAASTASTGTVSSVGLSLPSSLFTLSGSPVTSSGTLSAALATQSANQVWAGPTSGAAAAPTFRALVAADLPAGTGTVSSVALALPSSLFTVSGSPVTSTGTLAGALVAQNPNTVLAGPSSGSSAAAPTMRPLVSADIPASSITNTQLANAPATTIKGNASGSAAAPSDLTPAQAKTLLGYASSGANTDITSLAGLTTPLSLGQGGTGTTSISGALDTAFGATQGNVLYRGTSAWASLGPGTSGQVLTTGGTSANPSWTTPSSGGGGGLPSAFATKSANYTVAAADANTQFTLSGSATLTLPSASSFGAGKGFFLRKIDGNGVWAVTPSSGNINGLSSINCYQESYAVVSDGTNWQTQDRPKGWVNIGSTTVSAAAASVGFTVGFGDAELRDMEILSDNVTPSASDQLVFQVKQGTSYLTSGYVTNLVYNSSTTAAASLFYNNYSQGYVAPQNDAGPIFTRTVVQNINGAVVQRVRSEGLAVGNNRTFSGDAYQTTAAATAGFRLFFLNNATISSGAVFSQRAFRP